MTYKEKTPCTVCGKGTLQRKEIVEELEYKGATETVPAVLFECSNCEEGSFFSKESERELDCHFTELRRRVDGLLGSSDIRALRKKLGLTQEELSRLIKMDPKTIARYESGSVLQSSSADQILRLLIHISNDFKLLSAFASANGVTLKEHRMEKSTIHASRSTGAGIKKAIQPKIPKKTSTAKVEKEAA